MFEHYFLRFWEFFFKNFFPKKPDRLKLIYSVKDTQTNADKTLKDKQEESYKKDIIKRLLKSMFKNAQFEKKVCVNRIKIDDFRD